MGFAPAGCSSLHVGPVVYEQVDRHILVELVACRLVAGPHKRLGMVRPCALPDSYHEVRGLLLGQVCLQTPLIIVNFE